LIFKELGRFDHAALFASRSLQTGDGVWHVFRPLGKDWGEFFRNFGEVVLQISKALISARL
jgi:hypothetical protein